jgi:precorrin-6Y C5,15-methyltransferase (decarboxylating)
MTGPWLTVIGIGEDGRDGLPGAALALIDGAERVIGGARHLALAGRGDRGQAWPQPFAAARPLLESWRGRKVVVLASGDPLWFGAAATLARWFDPAEITVLPHVGAFSLAAARLGWPLQECLCLSIHGRPLDAVALHLAPGRRLLILAEDRHSPAAIAGLLADLGYGPSRLTVLERLGGPRERVHEDVTGAADDLAVIAVACAAAPETRPLSTVPGLPDEAFLHDGQITKRDIRAATLAALAPLPGALLWDVGAGSGSVAIEWMRAGGRAAALEPDPVRRDRIARNAARLGVPDLTIRAGAAPADLPLDGVPDAVFVGGGTAAEGVLETCWAALKPGGRLVANAVTAEGEAALLAFHRHHGGEMVRLAVSHLAALGSDGPLAWRPALPVTQYRGWKP